MQLRFVWSLVKPHKINSLDHSSIGTPLAWPHCCGLGLRLLVSIWFQKLFHSPSGVLFTFPSRYLFTIGHYEYLALDLSRPDFLPDFSCLVVLKKKFRNCMMFRYTGLSPSAVRHSRRVLLHSTQKSFAALLYRTNPSYYALYATPVSFKSRHLDKSKWFWKHT